MYVNRKGLQLSQRELFSTDDTLAKIMHPVLTEFQDLVKKTGSAPSSVAEHFGWMDDKGDFNHDQCHSQWVHCLSSMIWAFDPDNNPVMVDPTGTSEIYDEYVIKRQEGRELFALFFDDLWV